MKITVELPDSDLEEICFFTGETKKGPAIRKMVLDTLMMKRREKCVQEVLDGKWGVELSGFEAGRLADRWAAEIKEKQWRE